MESCNHVVDRKWLPTLAELLDRLTIHQLKEVFVPDKKEKYAKEMIDIMHDIDMLISEENIPFTANIVRAIVVLSQINTHIWYNERDVRLGQNVERSNLRLTHGLNGIRSRIMNYILELIGQLDRQDYKVDCLAEDFKDWDISHGQ